MADDPKITPEVEIKADDAKEQFNLLAEVAEAAFGRIGAAARLLGPALSGPLGIIALITGAVIALAEATSKFADSQAKAQIALNDTAKAFGTGRDEIVALRRALAGTGISAEDTGRILDRMAQRIGEAWSSIAQETRKGPLAMAEARLGIENAQIGISQALTNQSFAAQEWAQKLRANALTVTEAYNRVKNAAQDAASQTNNDALGVKAAQLSVREAELRSRGGGSEAEQQALAKERGQLALDQANQQLADAELKQAKDLENQPLAQARAQLGLDQARTTAAKDQESVGPALQKAAADFDGAVLGFKSATDKMQDVLLKDLPTVIEAIRSKNGDFLKQVSSDTFAKASQELARQDAEARNGGKKVSDFDVVLGIAEQMKNLTGVIEQSQKIAVERQFGVPKDQAIEFSAALDKLSTTFPALLADTIAKGLGGTEQNQANAEAVRAGQATLEDMRGNMARLAGTSDEVTAIAKANQETWTAILTTLNDLPKNIAAALAGVPIPDNGISSPGETGSAGFAGGGSVFGPGNSKSDSIPARLSHGEYVIQADAVRAYGVDLFHALNDMTVGGFAMGGLVSAPAIAPMRFADGGLVSSSVVNLSIDGNRFDGLKAPQDVAAKLTSYAISRQTAQTGRTPSWVR